MSKPNVAEDLRRIHMIVTRGLEVSAANAARFVQEGLSDPTLSEGYRCYVAALLSVLHAHHLAEDDIAFPYFGERLPEAPFRQLGEEHQRIERLLEQAGEALERLDEEPAQRLPQLESVLRQIQELWRPHIALEEAHFDVERLAELMPPEEHGRLAGMMAKHSMEHAGPDYLVVPFVLYNLPADQRDILAAAMPPLVTQQLVPGAWKEQWAPMRPFLLD